MTRLFASLAVATALLLAGCAPKLSPLYRDYAVAPSSAAETQSATSTDAATLDRIRAALVADGWALAEQPGAALVRTEQRRISEWGLYRVDASLEVVPLGDDYVRVMVHPYRNYITGGRTKIPFLQKRMRRVVMPSVTEALEAQGLALAGTSEERDEEATES
jgi:hypothetical protein